MVYSPSLNRLSKYSIWVAANIYISLRLVEEQDEYCDQFNLWIDGNRTWLRIMIRMHPAPDIMAADGAPI